MQPSVVITIADLVQSEVENGGRQRNVFPKQDIYMEDVLASYWLILFYYYITLSLMIK